MFSYTKLASYLDSSNCSGLTIRLLFCLILVLFLYNLAPLLVKQEAVGGG